MNENFLNLLKHEVWKKAIGTDRIVDEDHYYRLIASKISKSEEVEISKVKNADSIHWETVKGFFKNGRNTRKDTLDILSWYVIGGEELKTYENFKLFIQAKPEGIKKIPSLKRAYWLLPILLLLAFAIGFIFYQKKSQSIGNENKIFVEDFDVKAIDMVSHLLDNGWQINERMDKYLDQQLRDSVLTLYTLGGAYWAPDFDKGGNKGYIKNLIYREIDCDCCTIHVQLIDFFPKQNWQQAGFYLLEEILPADTSKDNWLRMTALYSDGYHRIEALKYKNNQAYRSPTINIKKLENDNSPIEDVWLMVEVRGNEFTFYYRYRYSWGYKKIDTYIFDYKPKYLAIAGLRGLIKGSYVPAYFNKVIVEQCN